MTIKLHEFPKFDPDRYKDAAPFDWLGRRLSATHEVIAERAPGRVWEVRCGACRHAYILNDSQIRKGCAAMSLQPRYRR
jgi:hypothetical protein